MNLKRTCSPRFKPPCCKGLYMRSRVSFSNMLTALASYAVTALCIMAGALRCLKDHSMPHRSSTPMSGTHREALHVMPDLHCLQLACTCGPHRSRNCSRHQSGSGQNPLSWLCHPTGHQMAPPRLLQLQAWWGVGRHLTCLIQAAGRLSVGLQPSEHRWGLAEPGWAWRVHVFWVGWH